MAVFAARKFSRKRPPTASFRPRFSIINRCLCENSPRLHHRMANFDEPQPPRWSFGTPSGAPTIDGLVKTYSVRKLVDAFGRRSESVVLSIETGRSNCPIEWQCGSMRLYGGELLARSGPPPGAVQCLSCYRHRDRLCCISADVEVCSARGSEELHS